MHASVRLAVVFAWAPAAVLSAQAEPRPEDFQLAIGLQQRGLHEEAAGYLTKFLAASPRHALAAEAHYRLAQCRLELGQTAAARAALEAALARGGSGFALRAEALYRLGNLLEQAGEHRAALAQFTALADEVPADHYLLAAARYAAGEALREVGDDGAAADAFAAAAAAATGERARFRFPALYQLGFARARLQQHEPAAQAFAAAMAAATDDAARAECAYLTGDAWLRLSRWDDADTQFRRAQELGGDFADDACCGRGWVAVGRGDRAAVLQAFGELLTKYPDSPFAGTARLERARCLYQEQRFADAERELAPLLADEHPQQQAARELAGLCALASGAGEAAVQALQEALAAAAPADRPRLSFALGEALVDVGRCDAAVAAYDAVPDDAPADLRGDARYGACHALHQLGRHQESIARAEAVLAIEPAHRSAALARLAIAENRFALGDYAAAEPIYAALQRVPEHRDAAAWKLAWCRYLRGDKADAAERFGAIARAADGANAEEALSMQALALLEAGAADDALAAADRYRARHRDGRFLDRTERIAARVLRQRGDLAAAQTRLAQAAAAAAARDGAEAASADVAEQAELAYQQGDYRTADGLFAQLGARSDAIGARALAGRAWCAFELGDDDACRAALTGARAHPAVADELPGLYELESALCHRRKEWPAAIAAAQAFLQRFPEHEHAPRLRYALGVALSRSGDAAGARRVLAALADDGSYAEPDRVRYELAWACRRMGDEPAALAAFAAVAAATADPELAGESRLFVGTALLAKQPPDLAGATAALEAVAGAHRPQALYRLAFAEFAAAGDGAEPAPADKALLAKARDHCAAIGSLPPPADDAALPGEALFLGAECCRRLGDPRGAFERAQALLRSAPEHARADRARLLVGEAALALGDADAAVAALVAFLGGGERERGDAARANLWLGQARRLRREYDAAEQCFTAVTTLSDGELGAEAQFRLGECRRDRDDLRGAADAFVKLPILYASPRWVRAGLLQAGLVYERLQEPAKAARFFRELVERHAGSDEAKAAGEHLQDR